MKTIYSTILLCSFAMAFVSCADKYNIVGTTSQYFKDGTMAYIKQFEIGSDEMILTPIDSCEVLHGKFSMTGVIDSMKMVRLYIGDENFPMVLEQGQIAININDNQVKIEGTELNDKLYKFLSARDSLKIIYDDLPNRETKMYLEGYSSDDIAYELSQEVMRLELAIDKLDTQFVKDNYDNVLGVTWFMLMCYEAHDAYGFVTTTPQIDEIYSQAPESFKKNRLVVSYMSQINAQ